MDEKKRKLSDRLFPDYRLYDEVPFGFWYVGFFGIVLAFFNLAINFFSHLSLLLGFLTDTLFDVPKDPGAFDLFLSGLFALYYLFSGVLFLRFSVQYWNFKHRAAIRFRRLLMIDMGVFVVYNLLYFAGLYLYKNHYLVPKLPIYIVLSVVALYYLFQNVGKTAEKAVVRIDGK
ncbi:MAG: hypothetical protein JW885_07355 [Deltaproteobacteria bacterium]|nr:hypothetical protein [Candidatus Zymogenaceae bacterium]